jgi:hypothetical protein
MVSEESLGLLTPRKPGRSAQTRDWFHCSFSNSPPYTEATRTRHITTNMATMGTEPSTAASNFIDGVEGITSFATREGLSYRFRIVAKSDKLRIWLEDRKTKKQWWDVSRSCTDGVVI